MKPPKGLRYSLWGVPSRFVIFESEVLNL
jgi:hypothetical protein